MSPASRRAGVVSLVALLSFVGVVAAQGDPRSSLGLGERTILRFFAGLAVNLILGGILLAASPQYVDRKLDEVREVPGEAIGWGLLVSLGGPIAIVVLAITIIGLLLALPGIFVLVVVGLGGAAVTVALVGGVATSSESVTWGNLLVGALVVAALSAVPLVGGLINWLVGLPGVGLVGRDLYQSVRG